jgi:hypothetical protein
MTMGLGQFLVCLEVAILFLQQASFRESLTGAVFRGIFHLMVWSAFQNSEFGLNA